MITAQLPSVQDWMEGRRERWMLLLSSCWMQSTQSYMIGLGLSLHQQIATMTWRTRTLTKYDCVFSLMALTFIWSPVAWKPTQTCIPSLGGLEAYIGFAILQSWLHGYFGFASDFTLSCIMLKTHKPVKINLPNFVTYLVNQSLKQASRMVCQAPHFGDW